MDDADGDGHLSSTAGGDDCDDEDAAVYPDAPEDPYDGVDTDCDPNNEYDADGDGVAARAFGGSDCDDLDATVHPDAADPVDAVDQDCVDDPPVVNTVTISPVAGDVSTPRTCVATGDDPDGDPIVWSWLWYADGVLVGSTEVLPAGQLRGTSIACEASASGGAPVSSATVVVENAIPSASGASLSPIEGGPASPFTCAGSGYLNADGDPEGWSYRWFGDGVELPGIYAAELPPGSVSVGASLRCVALPDDGSAEGAGVSSASVLVESHAPTASISADRSEGLIEGDRVEVFGQVGHLDVAPDQLELELWSDRQGYLGAPLAEADGSYQIVLHELESHVHTLSIVVTDPGGERTTVSTGVTVSRSDDRPLLLEEDVDVAGATIEVSGEG